MYMNAGWRPVVAASGLLWLALALPAVAETDTVPTDAPAPTAVEDVPAGQAAEAPAEEQLQWNPQHGKVSLPGGVAELDLPEAWLYLPPADAEQLLVYWGNPPGSGEGTLGMLVQSGSGPDDPDSWAVILTYDDSGHVSDDDAAGIDYDEVLAQMQAESADSNAFRREQGYPAVELVGWAEPPSYDAATRKFFWAKELAFEDNAQHTLNYNVRVLGREGVLEMNAIAGMSQLDMIRSEMPAVIAMASFVPGQRYEDFNEATDRLAGYGLAALVAGGVAAKTGLWAKLLVFLVAAKKLIIPLLIGAALFVPTLWKKWRGRQA